MANTCPLARPTYILTLDQHKLSEPKQAHYIIGGRPPAGVIGDVRLNDADH